MHITGFNSRTDMPADFQKAIECTLFGLKNIYCFLDNIMIVSKGIEHEHKSISLIVFVESICKILESTYLNDYLQN